MVTITITEDSYNTLLKNKLQNESFSEEIKRVLFRRSTKKLSDFFGILTEKEGEEILKEIEKRKAIDIKTKREVKKFRMKVLDTTF